MGGRSARTDQPRGCPPLSMTDDQQSPPGGVADRNEPILIVRMIRISEGRSQRIIEYGDGLVKRHAMSPDVRCGLTAVPLEAHACTLTKTIDSVRPTNQCIIRRALSGPAPRAGHRACQIRWAGLNRPTCASRVRTGCLRAMGIVSEPWGGGKGIAREWRGGLHVRGLGTPITNPFPVSGGCQNKLTKTTTSPKRGGDVGQASRGKRFMRV